MVSTPRNRCELRCLGCREGQMRKKKKKVTLSSLAVFSRWARSKRFKNSSNSRMKSSIPVFFGSSEKDLTSSDAAASTSVNLKTSTHNGKEDTVKRHFLRQRPATVVENRLVCSPFSLVLYLALCHFTAAAAKTCWWLGPPLRL